MASNLEYIYRLKDQYSKKLASITRKQAQFTATYRQSMGKVNASSVAHQRQMSKSRSMYKSSKVAIDNLNKSLNKLNQAQGMNQRIGSKAKLGSTGKGANLGGIVGGAGAGMFLKGAFDTSVAFEGQLNNIIALNNTFDRDLMKSKAMEWGITTEHSALAVASAMREATQTGMNQNDVIKSMPGNLALASAGQMDLRSAMALSTDVVNQFGRTIGNLDIANQLAVGGSKSTSTVQQLGAALQNSGAQAHLAGLKSKQTMIALMAMGETGLRGEGAGTYFTRMLTNLRVGGPKIKKAFKTFLAGTNKQMSDFVSDSGTFTNFEGFMDTLREADKEKLGKFSVAFGQQGMKAITSIGAVSKEQLTMFRNEMKLTDNRAKEMADGLMKGLPGGLRLFDSALETTKLIMMDRFVAPLSLVLRSIANVLVFLSSNAPILLQIAFGLLGVLTAVTALGIASWVTIGAMTNLKIAFLAVTTEAMRNRIVTLGNVAITKVKIFWDKASALWTSIRTSGTKKESIAIAWNTGAQLVEIASTKALSFAKSILSARTKALALANLALRSSMAIGKMIAFTAFLGGVFTLSSLASIAVKAFTASQWLLNAALTANPIGIIIVAVGALVGVFIYAYTKLGSFTEAFKFTGLVLIKNFLTPLNLISFAIENLFLLLAKLPSSMGGNKFKSIAESIQSTREKVNMSLTGNDSLTQIGMVDDLMGKGSGASTYLDQQSQGAVQSKNQSIKNNVIVQGDIVVSATNGSKVERQNITFNTGRNMPAVAG